MNRISQGLTGWMAPPLRAISVCLALSSAAQAADASASRPAAAAASHGAGHGAAPHAGRTYVTVAGDTADRVVKKAMADIPLKDEILRDALIQANPKVFTAGAKTRLKAGTELALPDPHPMLRQILLPLLEPKEAGAYFPPPPVSVEERRRWVRYP
jgi:Tfp pilus assembly protein FimV